MSKVIEKIQSLLEKKKLVLVGIDGLGGAGKSSEILLTFSEI